MRHTRNRDQIELPAHRLVPIALYVPLLGMQAQVMQESIFPYDEVVAAKIEEVVNIQSQHKAVSIRIAKIGVLCYWTTTEATYYLVNTGNGTLQIHARLPGMMRADSLPFALEFVHKRRCHSPPSQTELARHIPTVEDEPEERRQVKVTSTVPSSSANAPLTVSPAPSPAETAAAIAHLTIEFDPDTHADLAYVECIRGSCVDHLRVPRAGTVFLVEGCDTRSAALVDVCSASTHAIWTAPQIVNSAGCTDLSTTVFDETSDKPQSIWLNCDFIISFAIAVYFTVLLIVRLIAHHRSSALRKITTIGHGTAAILVQPA